MRNSLRYLPGLFLRLPSRTAALLLAGLLAAPGSALGEPILFSISARDDMLHEVDPRTGETLSSVPVAVAGELVMAGHALATHPVTGELYAVLDLSNPDGTSRRVLAVVDPLSGAAKLVGETDRLVGLAFASDGTLFGVTSGIATAPKSLLILDTSNASAMRVCGLPNGDAGKAVAFHSAESTLFHAAGTADRVFERVVDFNPDPCATSGVALGAGLPPDRPTALAFVEADATFLWAQHGGAGDSELFRVAPDGAVVSVGPMSHRSKGLAFFEPPTVPEDPPGAGAADFVCHKVRSFGPDGLQGRVVSIEDALSSQLMRVGRPYRYCEPVSGPRMDPETGREVFAPSAGDPVVCYRLEPHGHGKTERIGMRLSNAFEDDRGLVVHKPRTLCVSSKRMEVFPAR